MAGPKHSPGWSKQLKQDGIVRDFVGPVSTFVRGGDTKHLLADVLLYGPTAKPLQHELLSAMERWGPRLWGNDIKPC
jgi:hypothetical protein